MSRGMLARVGDHEKQPKMKQPLWPKTSTLLGRKWLYARLLDDTHPARVLMEKREALHRS